VVGVGPRRDRSCRGRGRSAGGLHLAADRSDDRILARRRPRRGQTVIDHRAGTLVAPLGEHAARGDVCHDVVAVARDPRPSRSEFRLQTHGEVHDHLATQEDPVRPVAEPPGLHRVGVGGREAPVAAQRFEQQAGPRRLESIGRCRGLLQFRAGRQRRELERNLAEGGGEPPRHRHGPSSDRLHDGRGTVGAVAFGEFDGAARQRILIGPAADPDERGGARMPLLELDLRVARPVPRPLVPREHRGMAGIARGHRTDAGVAIHARLAHHERGHVVIHRAGEPVGRPQVGHVLLGIGSAVHGHVRATDGPRDLRRPQVVERVGGARDADHAHRQDRAHRIARSSSSSCTGGLRSSRRSIPRGTDRPTLAARRGRSRRASPVSRSEARFRSWPPARGPPCAPFDHAVAPAHRRHRVAGAAGQDPPCLLRRDGADAGHQPAGWP